MLDAVREDARADASNKHRREILGCSLHGPGKGKRNRIVNDVEDNSSNMRRRSLHSRGRSTPTKPKELDLGYW